MLHYYRRAGDFRQPAGSICRRGRASYAESIAAEYSLFSDAGSADAHETAFKPPTGRSSLARMPHVNNDADEAAYTCAAVISGSPAAGPDSLYPDLCATGRWRPFSSLGAADATFPRHATTWPVMYGPIGAP